MKCPKLKTISCIIYLILSLSPSILLTLLDGIVFKMHVNRFFISLIVTGFLYVSAPNPTLLDGIVFKMYPYRFVISLNVSWFIYISASDPRKYIPSWKDCNINLIASWFIYVFASNPRKYIMLWKSNCEHTWFIYVYVSNPRKYIPS